MKLGKVLRRRRAELGLRQRHVADQAGVTEDYLSLVERDQRTPSLDVLDKLAGVLQVPASYLLLEAEPLPEHLSDDTRILVEDARKVAADLLRRIDEMQRQQELG